MSDGWCDRRMTSRLFIPDPKVEAVLDELGFDIRSRRSSMGLSQEVLGRWSGLSQSTVSRLERGLANNLPLERYARAVAVLRAGHAVRRWDVDEVWRARNEDREDRRARRLHDLLRRRRAALADGGATDAEPSGRLG